MLPACGAGWDLWGMLAAGPSLGELSAGGGQFQERLKSVPRFAPLWGCRVIQSPLEGAPCPSFVAAGW